MQSLVVKQYGLMVDIEAAVENGFYIPLSGIARCLYVVFAAGSQLADGTVYGIYFGL